MPLLHFLSWWVNPSLTVQNQEVGKPSPSSFSHLAHLIYGEFHVLFLAPNQPLHPKLQPCGTA